VVATYTLSNGKLLAMVLLRMSVGTGGIGNGGGERGGLMAVDGSVKRWLLSLLTEI
jgi:hypothetical protein